MSDLEKQVDEYSLWFKRRKMTDPTEDHSKHFIIFIYNYLDLNLDKKAKDLIPYITKDYLINKFIEDLHYCVKMRNKSKRKIDSGLDGTNESREAEFFLCGMGVLNFLRDNKVDGTEEMLEKLKEESFKIDTENKGMKIV